MACEVLGSIGAPRSVPALLARLTDRRPEVRIAAVRALGDIRSEEAVPALSEAFLERRVAPTNIVNNALRRIGGEAASTFQLGIVSADPIVRVSSCFGLSGIGGGQAATTHLSKVLISDTDTRVRAAAAAALGIVGGEQVPTELIGAAADPDVNVRRHAVKALGSFDDPTTGMILVACTEDEDRETALRAAEALVALSHRPRAGPEVRAQLESCPAWAIQYIRQVAEVTA